MRIEFHPEALVEFAAAATDYQKQQRALATVEFAIRRIDDRRWADDRRSISAGSW